MLSTAYRVRLQEICDRIANQEEVSLSDVIWAEKLSKSNRSAGSILRQARRKAANPEMTEESLDGFLNALDLGDPDPSNHRTAKLSMIVFAVILPFLFLLSCLILISRNYVFGVIMATSVLGAGVGWLRALRYFLAPFTFHAAFYLDGLRLWRSDKPDSVAFYSRTEIDRFLIEPNVVTFSIQSSWIEKGFVGIYWNEPRIQELERFLAQYWPET